jgi:hypothetical protein
MVFTPPLEKPICSARLLKEVRIMKTVTAKIANMRKPQEFVVYLTSDKGNIIVQSDKCIGSFDAKTGIGLLNTKGCYFPHLSQFMGAKQFTFPTEFVLQCMAAQTDTGDLIGQSAITGKVYMGTVIQS